MDPLPDGFDAPVYTLGRCVRPFPGEARSGDALFAQEHPGVLVVAAVDGVGHGRDAAGIAEEAVAWLGRSFAAEPLADLPATLTRMHRRFRNGRGASLTLARLDARSGAFELVAVGNTVARVVSPGRSRSFLSRDGNLGHFLPSPRLERGQLEPGAMLLLYSDGVKSSFDFESIPGRHTASAQTVAQKIVKAFGKPHDDACCLVLKRPR